MESVSKVDIRQSAKKVRHILDEVKNLKVVDALNRLRFMNKKSAKYIHHLNYYTYLNNNPSEEGPSRF